MGCLFSKLHGKNKDIEKRPLEDTETGRVFEIKKKEEINRIESTQLSIMSSILSKIPEGSDSRGKLTKLRLLRKSSLLGIASAVSRVNLISEILSEITMVETRHCVYGDSRTTCDFSISENGKNKLKLFHSKKIDPILEAKLKWCDGSSDEICDIFDLESCPPFTFISHRWAPNSAALGVHSELLYVLSCAPQNYIWLDCCCAPQDRDNFEDKNVFKVIWNIAEILDKATSVLSYYATDGLSYQDEISHGLHALKAICGTNLNGQFFNDLAPLDAKGSSRLWCVYEKLIGKDKFMGRDVQLRYYGSSSDNIFFKAHKEMKKIHGSNQFSLDCFDENDIEPVTVVMFERKVFPALLVDGLPMVRSESGVLVHGVMLPTSSDLFGWYTCITNPGKPTSYNYHCNIEWPQNKKRSGNWPCLIKLQVHAECLERSGESTWTYSPIRTVSPKKAYWTYSPKKALENADFFNYDFDECGGRGRFSFRRQKCLFCDGK